MLIQSIGHIDVAVDDISAASTAYRLLFGFEPILHRGEDDRRYALFSHTNVVLRLIETSKPQTQVSLSSIDALGLSVSRISEAQKHLRRVGLLPGGFIEPVQIGSESHSTNPIDIIRLPFHRTFGVQVSICEAPQSSHLTQATRPQAFTGLDHVVIKSSEPDRAAALYGARLGLPMKLDVDREDWGLRLMFFQCGDSIIEIAHRHSDADKALDQLWGLSWRVTNIALVREKLVRKGLEVSEIRSGRRPGTRVATVKSGAYGIPTLIIQPAASGTNRGNHEA